MLKQNKNFVSPTGAAEAEPDSKATIRSFRIVQPEDTRDISRAIAAKMAR